MPDESHDAKPQQKPAPTNPIDADLRPGESHETEQLDPQNEKDLWHGRRSWRTAYPVLALWLVVTLCATIGAGYYFKTWTAFLTALAACAVLLLVLVIRTAYQVWSTSYRITTQRLFIRRGILTQTIDQTELLRVDDVKMRQTILDRLLGVGSVHVLSNDRTDTEVLLTGIDDPAEVQEHIRRHTRMVQSRRTLFMEQL